VVLDDNALSEMVINSFFIVEAIAEDLTALKYLR
jgi:hypothetical protein